MRTIIRYRLPFSLVTKPDCLTSIPKLFIQPFQRIIENGSGGSHVTLSGSADSIDIKGSGGSHYNLQDYSVSDADINLSGGSHANVHVNGTLNVDISGGSEVSYTGEPTLGDIEVDWESELIER